MQIPAERLLEVQRAELGRLLDRVLLAEATAAQLVIENEAQAQRIRDLTAELEACD